MIQIHLLEAKVGRLGLRSDSAKTVYKHLELQVLNELKIDTGDFNASFNYYSTRPEVLAKIYDAVVDSLMEMESRGQLIEDEERKAKTDSLAMLNAKDSLSVTADCVKIEKPRPVLEETGNVRKLQKFKGTQDTSRISKFRKQ